MSNAVPTQSDHQADLVSVLLVSPTTATPALNALKAHSGAQLPTGASSSAAKTQPTLPAHVSATQGSDCSQDPARAAPSTTSSPTDIA